MQQLPPELAQLRLQDYHYDLPKSRIAAHPLEQRDQSRLLVYRPGSIRHRHFYELPQELPSDALLVFNDTRVIQARLYFRRKTGALIELLLMLPEAPRDITQAMEARGRCQWRCMIGNKKRWKNEEVLSSSVPVGDHSYTLQARLLDRATQVVELSWEPTDLSLAQLLQAAGELPLPPYLERKATRADLHQYQTVYAQHDGAIAAPTAGLHMTPAVLQALAQRGIRRANVTLHVGAGTFQPIKQQAVAQHDMHAEQIILTHDTLQQLRTHEGPIVAVGTTSMRLLESIYWLGVQLLQPPSEAASRKQGHGPLEFFIPQYAPYQAHERELPNREQALQAILDHMRAHGLARMVGETSIYLLPSYSFRLCRGLITNFHLPASTLILLVAAFIGEDWRKVYQEALEQGYRFLSYGDSSLLLPEG